MSFRFCLLEKARSAQDTTKVTGSKKGCNRATKQQRSEIVSASGAKLLRRFLGIE